MGLTIKLMTNYKYLLIILFLFLPLISLAIVNPIRFSTFPEVFTAIVTFLQIFGTPVAIIMFLYGGFLYLTSGGSQEKVKTAHRTMTWSAVGLGVIIIGTAFVKIICAFLQATSCPV